VLFFCGDEWKSVFGGDAGWRQRSGFLFNHELIFSGGVSKAHFPGAGKKKGSRKSAPIDEV
jgi:hypothetical protein